MVRHLLLFATFCLAAVCLATRSSTPSFTTISLPGPEESSSSSSSSSKPSPSSTTPAKTSQSPPPPSSKCFYPNGKPEQTFEYDYQPCGGKNTTWNQCCIPGQDRCTENGLCTHLTNAVGAFDYRGGCTSADWSGCPQVCLDVLSNSWLQVKQCASGEYCCNPDFDHGDCCRDGSRRFSLLGRNPDAKGGGTPGKTNGTDNSDGKDKSNNSVKIGAAVGGSLGGIAAIGGVVAVWLVLRKRKQQKTRRDEDNGAEANNSGTAESLGMKHVYVPGSETVYTPLAEVEGQPAVVEMDSRGVHELG